MGSSSELDGYNYGHQKNMHVSWLKNVFDYV